MTDLPSLDAMAILSALAAREVDFVLIGGLAAITHGARRATFDLDVVIHQEDPDNAGRMAAAYADLGASSAKEEHVRDAGHLQVVTRSGRVDIVRHPDYERLKRSAVEVEVAGVRVLVAGRDELIAMKLAAGRPKDLQDVADMTAYETEER